MKKTLFTLFLIITLIPASYTQSSSNLYRDIFLNTKNSDYILFGNRFINIAINKKTGEWEKLNGFGNTFFASLSASPAFDIKIDDKMVLNERKSGFIDFRTTLNKQDNSVSLHVTNKFESNFELITTYILYSQKALMERSASITYLKDNAAGNKKLEAFISTYPTLLPVIAKIAL